MSEVPYEPETYTHTIRVGGAVYCTNSPLDYDVRAKIEAAIEASIAEALDSFSHGFFNGSVTIDEPGRL